MHKASAFSLVEVTMALGIVAFALITIFGLFSVGLDTFHKSIDTTVQTQIAQNIFSTIRQTDYSVLTGTSSGNPITSVTRYYDDQGNEVQTSSYVYTATVAVSGTTQLPSGVSSPNLATVSGTITNITNKTHPFVYSTVVANNGQ